MYPEITHQDILNYNKCHCGAITLSTPWGDYSCETKDFKKYFPSIDLRKLKNVTSKHKWAHCDYCVNHYGLDLCSCGSGKKVNKCDCGSKKPMQKFKEYTRVTANDSLLAGG